MTKPFIALFIVLLATAGCSDSNSDTSVLKPDVGANDSGHTLDDASLSDDASAPNDAGVDDAGISDAASVNDAGISDAADLSDDANIPDEPRAIGPRPVTPTAVELGTLFAAPDGTGDACSLASPCDIYTVTSAAAAGDVIFMRGGIYTIDRNLDFRGRGTSPAPPIFESYPGEVAILDGSGQEAGDNVYIRVLNNPVVLRLFEIRKMARSGISVRTSDNVLEGLRVYDNLLSGIHVHESYDAPTSNNNLITDCVVFGNSGAGIFDLEYNDGGNSDGISMSSGIGNRIENVLSYNNSDDGIDTWRTLGSYVGYSITYGNGIANGNGQGFKSGGAPPSAGTTVEHSLSYSNKGAGFDQNSGLDVEFFNNTSWDNGRGYWFGNDTTGSNNVAFETTNPANDRGNQTDNSWQRAGAPTPLSTDPASPDFLVPAPGFDDIGAHAGR